MKQKTGEFSFILKLEQFLVSTLNAFLPAFTLTIPLKLGSVGIRTKRWFLVEDYTLFGFTDKLLSNVVFCENINFRSDGLSHRDY